MKPILFHDIDGVLFGEHDGGFQLRPRSEYLAGVGLRAL